MERNSKIIGVFLKYYPWKGHFFAETVDFYDIKLLLKMLLEAKGLKNGKFIKIFENEFRNNLDPEGYLYSFGSGRMALYAILEALHIGEGDEVILPAFTCEVVVHALLYRKIRPIYADIEPDTFNLDIRKIERSITHKTKAIIAQHSFGVPCELEEILEIANKHGIFVIEDCALALGSNYKGKPVGTYGRVSFFSTDKTKIISTFSGGMAFTKDKAIAEKIRVVYDRSPFLSKCQILNIACQIILSYLLSSPFSFYLFRFIMGAGRKLGVFFYHRDNKKNFQLPSSYPCRLSNLQSALGLHQLKKLPLNLKKRHESVKRYADILKENGINLNNHKVEEITLRFSILLKDRNSFTKKWGNHLRIEKWFDSPASGWYKDLYRIGYEAGTCPVAEFVHQHIINIPTYQKSKVVRNFIDKIISDIQQEGVAIYEKN